MGALFFAINVITFSGFFELPMIIDKLPIFYKQRDLLMYPSWAFSLPTSVLRIPISIVEVAFWTATTYYSLGYDSGVIRSVSNNQLSLSAFFFCLISYNNFPSQIKFNF